MAVVPFVKASPSSFSDFLSAFYLSFVLFSSSSFSCVSTVISILKLIRNNRIDDARFELESSLAKFPFSKLLAELSLRLNTDSSPHILVDGIWF